MTKIRVLLASSEKSTGAPPPSAAPPGSTAPAVLLGGTEDTRLLLRGLLRLHRHRVLLEAPTREALDRMPPTPETKILILDAGSDKGNEWADELASVLTLHPDLRALVILPRSDPSLQTRARKAGAQAVLVRPFAIRDFVQAVDSVGAEPPSR